MWICVLGNQLDGAAIGGLGLVEAVQVVPENAYPHANLARLMVQGGDHEQADIFYRRVADLAMKKGQMSSDGNYTELLLQAHLWLHNLDTAALALARLASVAQQGNGLALFRLQEQARECYAIGLGPALAELMEASELSDFLRPIALALHAAVGGHAEALEGLAPELRTMAETVLEDLLSHPSGPKSQGIEAG